MHNNRTLKLGTSKWDAAIINVVNYTCAFTPNCCEVFTWTKSLLILSVLFG